MIEVAHKVAQSVRQHAAITPDRECCGLAVQIDGQVRYIPCRNIADADSEFEIHPDDYADADEAGEIIMVCHSHITDSCKPSKHDICVAEAMGIPWLIVSKNSYHYFLFNPSYVGISLDGRNYEYGRFDCYQILVDYYSRNLRVALPYVQRPKDNISKSHNLYCELYEQFGFVKIEPGKSFENIRKHDILLLTYCSEVPNHAGVYLGDEQVLHHAAGRLSCVDRYTGGMQSRTTNVLRHKSQL